MAIVLTAGQAADSPQFIPGLNNVRVRLPVGRPRTRPTAVAGDKAYSSRANRAHLRKRHGQPPISRVNNAAGQYT
ncbi:Transposase DDE domain-containing protein [Streptomyces mirabilis]|uniref:Transposase DDE domain-containing protein n=1 Tax=Streptomyces mirabilis TaxID=68239 RepID=A0A1I2QIX1_9ACTN|nr:Transposase DDE domain-containing protein [Streptomyces mirabilis]